MASGRGVHRRVRPTTSARRRVATLTTVGSRSAPSGASHLFCTASGRDTHHRRIGRGAPGPTRPGEVRVHWSGLQRRGGPVEEGNQIAYELHKPKADDQPLCPLDVPAEMVWWIDHFRPGGWQAESRPIELEGWPREPTVPSDVTWLHEPLTGSGSRGINQSINPVEEVPSIFDETLTRDPMSVDGRVGSPTTSHPESPPNRGA